MAATGTPRLSTYSTPATPAARSQSMAPGAQTALQTTAPTPAAAAASASAQQQQQQRQQAPPLPPPAVFDILPHLHALLNRLLIQKPTDASHAQQQHQGEDGSKPHGDSNSSNASAAAKGVGGSGGGGGGGTGAAAAAASATATTALPSDPDAQPLEIHQLTAASSALKVRLQKARQAVARLGDVDRTVDEQREEMAELEERVRKLRAVLQDMGVATAAAGEAKGLVTVGSNGSGGGGGGGGGGGDGGNDLVLRVPRPV